MPHTIAIPPYVPRPENRKRFTRADCAFLERSGLLPERYELIDGDIVVTMPQKSRHNRAVVLLVLWLARLVGPERVYSQATLVLADDSQPEPDLFVVAAPLLGEQDYPCGNDVAFVAEVSDTTLRDDLTTKAHLYAKAGIAEYWVLDIIGRRIIVHRQPSASGYHTIFACGDEETQALLLAPEASVLVATLLPPVEGA